MTGERNLRQERRRADSPAGKRAAARGPARTERRSAATVWGDGGGDGELADERGEEEETEKETAREMVKASFTEKRGDLNRKRIIPCSLHYCYSALRLSIEYRKCFVFEKICKRE